MKILLIQPPSDEKRTIPPPLGLGYMASCLEKDGHIVKIIESLILKYNLNHITQEIKKFSPDVVGVSVVTEHFYNSNKILEIAKKVNPNCLTLLGGPYPSLNPTETLENSKFTDVVVRGEAEKTVVELLKKKRTKLKNIDGISYNHKGKIIHNKDRKLINNLDSLPLPAYHLFSMNKYIIQDKLFDIGLLGKQGDQYAAINTSRGCPFGCTFCSSYKLFKGKWRGRSPEKVFEEIKLLHQKYDKKVIDILDDTFTYNMNHANKILKLIIKENLDITLIITTRVDRFDREFAKNFKKAGGKTVFFGIESGNQESLDYLNKGFSIKSIKKAVRIGQDEGLLIAGSFIIGLPNETEDMINRTVSFAKNLNLDSARFPLLIPFPGTKIYKNLKRKNVLINDDLEMFNYSTSLIKNPHVTLSKLRRLQIKASIYTNIKFKILKRLIEGL